MFEQRRRRRRPFSSSVYPLHPTTNEDDVDGGGHRVVRWLAHTSDADLSNWDRILVASSSLVIVGSFLWIPALCVWAYRRWRRVTCRRRRLAYAALFWAAVGVYASTSSSCRRGVGRWLRIRKWSLWRAWVRFLAVDILLDQPKRRRQQQDFDVRRDDAILAFVPHGIFPFALGVGALTDLGHRVFGTFRPVVASAVLRVPVLGDLVAWLDGLDASRPSVDRALRRGPKGGGDDDDDGRRRRRRRRLGLVPGGIDEMFTGYPRPDCHYDAEYAIVRNGFLRLAARYGLPVVPVYCFGSTKLFTRWHVPALEYLSHALRVSLIVFYGVCGLPVPFRRRLTYIVGDPIVPVNAGGGVGGNGASGGEEPTAAQIQDLHDRFCRELQRLFERHKEAYGWGHKTLHLLSR